MAHHQKFGQERPRRKRAADHDESEQIVEPRDLSTVSYESTYYIRLGDEEESPAILVFRDYCVGSAEAKPEAASSSEAGGAGASAEFKAPLTKKLNRTAASLWAVSEPVLEGAVAVFQLASLVVRPTPFGVASYLHDKAGEY